MIDKPKRKSERLNRRKVTLLNKAYEISKFCEVDVALILRIRKTGQYITYTSNVRPWVARRTLSRDKAQVPRDEASFNFSAC
jgi:hypothetical protein